MLFLVTVYGSRFTLLSLHSYLDPPVFDDDLVGLDGLGGAVEAGAGAHVEAPAVPVAFDRVPREVAVGERRALVRAEVLDGVEAAVDVVERQLLAAVQLDRGAAPLGHVFHAPDGDELALARGGFRVRESSSRRLHNFPAS